MDGLASVVQVFILILHILLADGALVEDKVRHGEKNMARSVAIECVAIECQCGNRQNVKVKQNLSLVLLRDIESAVSTDAGTDATNQLWCVNGFIPLRALRAGARTGVGNPEQTSSWVQLLRDKER